VNKSLEGKVALVTGAAKGIGKGIALKLSQEGANIVVADILINEAEVVAQQLIEMGTKSMAIKLDVTSKQEIENVFALIMDRYRKIEILVTCAGTEQTPCSVIEIDEREWNHVLNVNLMGTLYCCQVVGREMIKQRYGKIITISSLNGKTGVPYTVAYNVSKFGVIGLTKTLANELAPYHINVSNICPGLTDTELLARVWNIRASMLGVSVEELYKNAIKNISLKRLAIPDDLGNLAVFLASDQSSYITGEIINVAGGLTEVVFSR
jgi:NAD(P)-dependent dehydrogenase (short-subunit alcohol dehydrogenase family)